MADYAWVDIKIANKDGNVEVVPAGEQVDAGKLNISKDEFANMKEAGAVREQKYPKDLRPGESLRERNVRVVHDQLAEAAENMYSELPELEPETSHLAQREVEQPKAETAEK
jgi:hypothetical protein